MNKKRIEIRYVRISWFIPLLLFIQYGKSVYMSVYFVGFVILSILYLRFDTFLIFSIGIVSLFIFPSVLPFWNSPRFVLDIAQLLRVLACIVFFLYVITRAKKVQIVIPKQYVRRTQRIVKSVIIVLFIVTLFQFIGIKLRYAIDTQFFVRLFPPETLFAIRDPAILSEFELLHALYLRPPAFFSEPSYLGFITLSLLLVAWRILPEKEIPLYSVILVSIVVMGQTLSGIILLLGMVIILWGIPLRDRRRPKTFTIFITLVEIGLLTTLGLYLSHAVSLNHSIMPTGYLLNRIPVELQGQGTSISRIILPSKLTLYTMKNYILGIPAKEIPIVTRGMVISLDNAFLGGFVYFGIMAIGLYVYIFYVLKDVTLIAYFIFASMFNGALFFYDKAVVMAIVGATYIVFSKLDSGVFGALDVAKPTYGVSLQTTDLGSEA